MCDVLLLFNNKFLGGAWLLAKFVLPENETKRNFVFLFLFIHTQNKLVCGSRHHGKLKRKIKFDKTPLFRSKSLL